MAASARLCLLYLALFAFIGAAGNYLSLYLRAAGWTEPQIGWIDGLRYVCVLVFPVAWSRLADRRGDLLGVLVLVTWACVLAFVPLLLTADFVPAAVSLTVWAAFRVGTIPMTDALALAHVRTHGGDYGKFRSWGSAGFIGGSILMGAIVAWVGRRAVPATLWGLLVATALLASTGRRPGPARPVAAPTRRSAALALLRRRPLAALYAVAFASRLTSQGLYSFLPLHLENLGVPDAWVPSFWIVGVLCEIALIRNLTALAGRWTARQVLVGCSLAAALQYGLTAIVTSPWVLLAVMPLHGITFGVWYVTTLQELGRLGGPGERATVQGLFQTFAFGLGATGSAIAAGYLFRAGQGPLLFGVAALASLPVALLAWWAIPEGPPLGRIQAASPGNEPVA